MSTEALSPGMKGPSHETDQLPWSSFEIKKSWVCTLTFSWRSASLVKHSDTFTLLLYVTIWLAEGTARNAVHGSLALQRVIRRGYGKPQNKLLQVNTDWSKFTDHQLLQPTFASRSTHQGRCLLPGYRNRASYRASSSFGNLGAWTKSRRCCI
jgi:hypothetical protein